MPDQIVDIPGVGPVAFPETMSDVDIAKASHRLHLAAKMPQAAEQARRQNPNAHALAPGAVRPVAERVGLELATNPNVRRAARMAAGPLASRAAGSVVGAVVGGPAGAVVGNELGRAAAPMTQRAVERGFRAGGGFLARLAANPIVQRATGRGSVNSLAFEPLRDYIRTGNVDIPRASQPTGARNSLFSRLLGANVGSNRLR